MTQPPTISQSAKSPWVGIAWMALTGVMFVSVTGIVRYVGASVPAAEAAFLRYSIGTILMLPFFGRAFAANLTRDKVGYFAARGVVHALGVILWFYAMAHIPIAEVTAIGYTSPIYIVIGAAFFFGERMAARRIIAVIIAFIGAMIIIRPGFHQIGSGQLAQLISAPLFAVSYLIAKRLSDRESPTVVVGMLSVFVTLGLLPFAIAVWQPPSLHDVLWLGLVAVFATAGHFIMTKALAAAPLMVTQPVTFLQLIWATLLGSLVFGEPADFWVLLGGGVIIASVSFISYREWVISRKARTPPVMAIK